MTRNGMPLRNFKNSPELWPPVPLEVCMKTYYLLSRDRFLSDLRTSFCALAIVCALSTFPSAEADTPLPVSGGFFFVSVTLAHLAKSVTT
jgi:hypothetical protein